MNTATNTVRATDEVILSTATDNEFPIIACFQTSSGIEDKSRWMYVRHVTGNRDWSLERDTKRNQYFPSETDAITAFFAELREYLNA